MHDLRISADSYALKQPFTISRGAVTAVKVVTVEISNPHHSGRGECRPYPRYGETDESVIAEIEACRHLIEQGADRAEINRAMRAGAARNAVDCALWDLEAKKAARPVWEVAGLSQPTPVEVTYTISLDRPAAMAEQARLANRPLLKLKLGGGADIERVAAVREAAPDSRLIVDANEAWRPEDVATWSAELAKFGVELIEQPLHAQIDEALEALAPAVPLCADESCHLAETVEPLRKRYEYVNIKLDKTGGLTAAIQLANKADELGFGIMLGCMMASSLAIAPAFLLASRAKFVDLDAPLLLAEDQSPAIKFEGSKLYPPTPQLWG